MKNTNKIWLFLFVLILMVGATACSTNIPNDSEKTEEIDTEAVVEKETVVFGDAGWDSLRLHNAIAAFILEEGYGYETDVIPGSSVNLIEGMVAGDIAVMMEMWQDNTPAFGEHVKSGTLMNLGTNFDDNAQGLYVPRYVIEGDAERGIEAMAPDLKTVHDLMDYSDLFPDAEDPGRAIIVNGPPSWAVTTIMEIKLQGYGLDEKYNIVGSGSSAALAASLAAAYEKGQPWVGYYWEPTWISGKYDIVLLEDAPFDEALWNEGSKYACEFKPEDVVIGANTEFMQNNPEVMAFLEKYKTSSALTAEALAYLQDNDAEIDEAAQWFILENQELVKEWVPEDVFTKVMTALK
ncbi:MAG: ABC transporter substrate-binding protein [Clostridiales bacterium]|nr:ABC transporter substrate-binding protein [Clostridiales bacterium]